METTEVKTPALPNAQEAACCATPAKRSRARQWLVGAGMLAAGAALYGGWDWLVASGVGVVVLGLAPCLAMCALGLCMGRGKKP